MWTYWQGQSCGSCHLALQTHLQPSSTCMNNTQIWEHISGKETIPSSWHHVLNIFCILDDFGASTLTKCHIESTYSAMHSPAELEAWRSLPQPLHTTPDLIKQLSLLNPGPIFRKFREIGPRDKPRWAKGYFLWRLTPPDIENQTAPRSLTWHERNITRLVNQIGLASLQWQAGAIENGVRTTSIIPWLTYHLYDQMICVKTANDIKIMVSNTIPLYSSNYLQACCRLRVSDWASPKQVCYSDLKCSRLLN